MRVIRASDMGFCFGVRDALDVAFRYPEPDRVTIHGELVHNESINDRLRDAGYRTTPEDRRRIPETDRVLITAHGISNRERDRLDRAGKQLVDTTCPLVDKAHRAVLDLAADGYHVVVIGKPGHVEVRGLVGDLNSYDVVPGSEMVGRYPYPRIGVVCQTTTMERTAREILETIEACNPDSEVRFVDTICEPTKQRVRALERLIDTADVIVVVGGSNSNNTRQLVDRCVEAGRRVHHVQGAGDLAREWFSPRDRIGLTAGTSTPDATIDEVHEALLRMSSGSEGLLSRETGS